MKDREWTKAEYEQAVIDAVKKFGPLNLSDICLTAGLALDPAGRRRKAAVLRDALHRFMTEGCSRGLRQMADDLLWFKPADRKLELAVQNLIDRGIIILDEHFYCRLRPEAPSRPDTAK